MSAPSSPTFDQTYDVVVVGTGGAGLATAMGAVDGGLRVLMLESTGRWGGNTAMSGGGMWLPDNALMRRDGVGDSRAEALAYLEATVGDVGRASTRERKEAYLDGIEDFVATAERFGLRFARATDTPDYYSERPGGKIGRGLEVFPFDLNELGAWAETINVDGSFPIRTDDVWLLGRAWSTPSGMRRGAQVVGRMLAGLARGQKLVGIGAALAAAFVHALVVQRGVDLWLNAPLEELVIEDGRVVGVRATREGRAVTVGATRGVMLAAGGFDYNREMRQQYQGIGGSPSGSAGNLGRAHQIAQDAGAAMELMDEAWWGASIAPLEGGHATFVVGERSMPYSLIVDARGERFSNESQSYVDLGHDMLEHDKHGDYWLITDSRHRRRYFSTFLAEPGIAKRMRQQGVLREGRTLAELAAAIDVDAGRLTTTIERFNGFARAGTDGDFGRGNSAYDRYYSDPTVHPNPCLGPLEKGPFRAFRLVIGDLGTKGGVVTDVDARALREDGTVIDGLYSSGNTSAAVMGRTYPGPGSTLGPAVVFGLRAARHMGRDLVDGATRAS